MNKIEQHSYITNRRPKQQPEFENKVLVNKCQRKLKMQVKLNLHLNSAKKLTFKNPLFQLSELDKRIIESLNPQSSRSVRSLPSFKITNLNQETYKLLRTRL